MPYRNVDTGIWNDPEIMDEFTPLEILFWFWLLTNPYNSICGVCKVSPRRIADELKIGYQYPMDTVSNLSSKKIGYEYGIDTVFQLIEKFKTVYKKIDYDEETQEIIILKFYRYNWTKSSLLLKNVEKNLVKVRTIRYIEYLEELIQELSKNGSEINTVSIPYRYVTVSVSVTVNKRDRGMGKEKKSKVSAKSKKIESNQTVIDTIVGYLNEVAGTSFRSSTESTKKHINARLNENFLVEDFKTVIDKKVDEWKDTDMSKYIRPETLFGAKFESYLNQPIKVKNNFKSKQDILPEYYKNQKKGIDNELDELLTDEDTQKILDALSALSEQEDNK